MNKFTFFPGLTSRKVLQVYLSLGSSTAIRTSVAQLGLLGDQGYDGPGNVSREGKIIGYTAGTIRVVSKSA